MEGNFLGVNGYIPQIKSKADAMKYAFDITTERNFSTGEVKINKDKAIEVYKSFTENLTLPDVTENSQLNNFIDKYSDILQRIFEKKEK